MVSVDDLIAEAKPRESRVGVCLDGALLAEHEQAEAELQRAVADGVEPNSLSDVPPSVAAAARVRELEERIRALERVFVFRALPPWEYRRLISAYPPDEPRLRWNAETFPPALIAACCIEPVKFASADDVRRLLEKLNEGVQDQLFDAAFRANEGGGEIPKSVVASAMIPTTGPRSTPPPAGE